MDAFYRRCLFLPLLFFSVYLLNKIPAATPEERQSRGERPTLNAAERKALLQTYLPGLAGVAFINLVLTILRDVKDNYEIEMIRQLKPDASPAIFARMETIAAVAVAMGFIILAVCAFFLQQRSGNPVALFISYTVGLYISYNTIQCLFLERFIAQYLDCYGHWGKGHDGQCGFCREKC
ncbi:MAG: DUF5690 family protein [Flavihumibacter sp.]